MTRSARRVSLTPIMLSWKVSSCCGNDKGTSLPNSVNCIFCTPRSERGGGSKETTGVTFLQPRANIRTHKSTTTRRNSVVAGLRIVTPTFASLGMLTT